MSTKTNDLFEFADALCGAALASARAGEPDLLQRLVEDGPLGNYLDAVYTTRRLKPSEFAARFPGDMRALAAFQARYDGREIIEADETVSGVVVEIGRALGEAAAHDKLVGVFGDFIEGLRAAEVEALADALDGHYERA